MNLNPYESYGLEHLTQFYNRTGIIFPRLIMDETSSLFRPKPGFPLNHWKNLNRRVWTFDEISKMSIEEFGCDIIEPENIRIHLLEYDIGQAKPYQSTEDNPIDTWSIGKVMKIGTLAFDSSKFPDGATATYGDWVHFSPINVKRTKFENGARLLTIDDISIIGTIESPLSYINN